MSENYEEIIGAALSLAPGARAMLAERLLESLNASNHTKEWEIVDPDNAPDSSSKDVGQAGITILTLDLAPELERKLKQEADRHDLPPEQYALRILDEHISHAERERREKLIALIESFTDENASPEEALDDDFFRMLDEDRTSYRKLFPPELKGISW